ncbi:hypothetical protein QLX08_002236 [Tetragonisca angustula]|uniref:Uncharacterized protein n=1 Tax=Tetragonisca angustula TaxID=166442 RepID=A0AAW1ABS8_9HYME
MNSVVDESISKVYLISSSHESTDRSKLKIKLNYGSHENSKSAPLNKEIAETFVGFINSELILGDFKSAWSNFPEVRQLAQRSSLVGVQFSAIHSDFSIRVDLRGSTDSAQKARFSQLDVLLLEIGRKVEINSEKGNTKGNRQVEKSKLIKKKKKKERHFRLFLGCIATTDGNPPVQHSSVEGTAVEQEKIVGN